MIHLGDMVRVYPGQEQKQIFGRYITASLEETAAAQDATDLALCRQKYVMELRLLCEHWVTDNMRNEQAVRDEVRKVCISRLQRKLYAPVISQLYEVRDCVEQGDYDTASKHLTELMSDLGTP